MAENLPELVDRWRHDDCVAVVDGATQLSYAELHRRSDAVAAALGDVRGAVVGVLLPRSADFVVAILGVLKAGAAYLPLDPGYPASRLDLMISTARCPVTVTSSEHADRLPGSVLVDAVPDAPFTPPPLTADDLAYVMFTSGSTGVPKGVEVTQRSVIGVATRPDAIGLSTSDVTLAVSSVSFDGATFDLWTTLAAGARLVIVPPDASAVELGDLARSSGATAVLFPTGLFHLLVDECLDSLTGLRTVLVGGDVLSAAHCSRFLAAVPECRLFNIYGPTEATCYVSYHEVPADIQGSVPIGLPAAGARLRVLDEQLRDAEEGQLHIGGDGLARGYLADPELTASRFVTVDGERCYATGDLVRGRADGALDFLRRLDNQVKKRGFRVEPGEVEAALRSDPDVRDAAVVLTGDTADTRRLVAHVVLRPGSELAAVRDRLDLPAYLHPDLWRELPVLPLTPNGKLDRAALSAPVAERPSPTAAARDEDVIAAIWQEVLDLPAVAPTDDFFDLGGHSLLANRVVARIRRRLGVTLPITALFDHPTVAELTSAVRAAAAL